jgi:hypothetical protein
MCPSRWIGSGPTKKSQNLFFPFIFRRKKKKKDFFSTGSLQQVVSDEEDS